MNNRIETKNTGTATADTSVENYRMRRTRRYRRESVCWTWLGHRLFILIFNNYVDIRNESIYKRIKVLIKFVCKLPFIFYLCCLLQFFNFRTKSTSSTENGHGHWTFCVTKVGMDVVPYRVAAENRKRYIMRHPC